MEKIRLKSVIAELNGGDIVRIIWRFLQKKAILFRMDLNSKHHHLITQPDQARCDQSSNIAVSHAPCVSTSCVEDPVLNHFLPNSTINLQQCRIATGN